METMSKYNINIIFIFFFVSRDRHSHLISVNSFYILCKKSFQGIIQISLQRKIIRLTLWMTNQNK